MYSSVKGISHCLLCYVLLIGDCFSQTLPVLSMGDFKASSLCRPSNVTATGTIDMTGVTDFPSGVELVRGQTGAFQITSLSFCPGSEAILRCTNQSGKIYTVVYNDYAKASYTGSSFKLRMVRKSPPVPHFSNAIVYPEVIEKLEESLQINEEDIDVGTEEKTVPEGNTTIKYSVSGMLPPYRISISWNGQAQDASTSEVTAIVNVKRKTVVTYGYSFKNSLCIKTWNITLDISKGCCPLGPGPITGIVIAIIFLLGLIILAVLLWLRRSMTKPPVMLSVEWPPQNTLEKCLDLLKSSQRKTGQPLDTHESFQFYYKEEKPENKLDKDMILSALMKKNAWPIRDGTLDLTYQVKEKTLNICILPKETKRDQGDGFIEMDETDRRTAQVQDDSPLPPITAGVRKMKRKTKQTDADNTTNLTDQKDGTDGRHSPGRPFNDTRVHPDDTTDQQISTSTTNALPLNSNFSTHQPNNQLTPRQLAPLRGVEPRKLPMPNQP